MRDNGMSRPDNENRVVNINMSGRKHTTVSSDTITSSEIKEKEDKHRSTQRLQKELGELTVNIPSNYSAGPKGDNLYEWVATIEGPIGSVYEGGVFFMEISIPKTYPFHPPKVTFRTRIYHCNINDKGFVNLDLLKEVWNPTCTMEYLLQAIHGLLSQCDPHSAIVPNIRDLYLRNRLEHDRIARMWTHKFAA